MEFANLFFTTWLQDLEKDMNSLMSILKKAEIDGKLLVGVYNLSLCVSLLYVLFILDFLPVSNYLFYK